MTKILKFYLKKKKNILQKKSDFFLKFHVFKVFFTRNNNNNKNKKKGPSARKTFFYLKARYSFQGKIRLNMILFPNGANKILSWSILWKCEALIVPVRFLFAFNNIICFNLAFYFPPLGCRQTWTFSFLRKFKLFIFKDFHPSLNILTWHSNYIWMSASN